MNSLRQVTLGILAALVSVAIIFGSLMMAFVESGVRLALPPSNTPLLSSSITPSLTPMPGTPTAVPVSDTPLPSETPTVTLTPSCTPPAGWSTITVQPGDTLESLAQAYNTTVKKLKAANCLMTNDLIPGTDFFVPGSVPTATEYDCGPPYGWVFYTVRYGDTLSSIARAFGTTVAALQKANCMGSSTFIRAGQQIHVPYHATSTPWISPTPEPTLIPTQSGTPEYPSTLTPMPTPTFTDPIMTPPGTPFPTIGPNPTLIAPQSY